MARREGRSPRRAPQQSDVDAEASAEPESVDQKSDTDEPSRPSLPPARRGADDRRTLRERLRPEVLHVSALVVLTLVCAGLVGAVVVKTRADATSAAREAAMYTPPPLPTASAGTGPVIAVIGDETATSPESGAGAVEVWPQMVGTSLEARITTYGGSGSGYTTAADGGTSFVDAVTQIPASADLVLFMGGASDVRASRLTIAKAATEAFAEAARQAPQAQVVAVGPLVVPATASKDQVGKVRESLRSAAQIANVRWIDPIAGGWLDDVPRPSGLTSADEQTVAKRLTVQFEKVLA